MASGEGDRLGAANDLLCHSSQAPVPCLEEDRRSGRSCRRQGFALQIEGLERLQKSVLHRKEGDRRAGRRTGL
jgi:hypothetical protein